MFVHFICEQIFTFESVETLVRTHFWNMIQSQDCNKHKSHRNGRTNICIGRLLDQKRSPWGVLLESVQMCKWWKLMGAVPPRESQASADDYGGWGMHRGLYGGTFWISIAINLWPIIIDKGRITWKIYAMQVFIRQYLISMKYSF